VEEKLDERDTDMIAPALTERKMPDVDDFPTRPDPMIPP
jgi:hypothetical protein